MNKTILSIITLILLLLPLTLAAEIHGNVYDINLNPAENIILKINTIPEQTYVSKDSSYAFTIKPGEYTISAEYKENTQKYTIQQEIKVIEEGSYILDLILFPDGQDIPGDIPEDQPEDSSYFWYIGIILIIIIIITAFYLKKKPKPIEQEEDDLTKKVMNFIKEEGGRTTQKNIRKKFPFSEAKISLVVTELEHKGVLKKIKKGRGNVIILNK